MVDYLAVSVCVGWYVRRRCDQQTVVEVVCEDEIDGWISVEMELYLQELHSSCDPLGICPRYTQVITGIHYEMVMFVSFS